MSEGWNVTRIPGHTLHHYFRYTAGICRPAEVGRGQGFFYEGPLQIDQPVKPCKICLRVLSKEVGNGPVPRS